LAIERLLARFTTGIVTVSDGQAGELADTYKIAPRQKIDVIRNGFDWKDCSHAAEQARAQLGIRPDQTVVMWIGRMVPIKGVRLLAEVILASQSNPSLLYLIAGDGPERSLFEQETKTCGNVRMLGWQEDVRPLWAACDVALLTSVNEGTPTSLIEAMFAAKPFVATDAGGTSELAVELEAASDGVRKGKNGFIVQSEAQKIAQCLDALAKSAALRESMGRAGRAHAQQNWSSERLLEEMKQLYHALTGRSKRRAHSA
jgi:glycosyltransferase involved in cell wall biosynthesis